MWFVSGEKKNVIDSYKSDRQPITICHVR